MLMLLLFGFNTLRYVHYFQQVLQSSLFILPLLLQNRAEKYSKRLPEDATNDDTFEARAHIIRFHTRDYCCVYVPTSLTADDDLLYTMEESLQIPGKEKDASYFNKSMCLHEYKWQQADVDTLTELLENSGPIWKDLVMILMLLKQSFKNDYHVQANAASFMSPNREMVVKNLLDHTIRVLKKYFYARLTV